jgi:Smg protein
MKEELFEVLMYLFENHIGREHPEQAAHDETLFHELADAGFTPEVIDTAFEWLDGVAALHSAEAQSEDNLGLSSGFRVFSREELAHFGPDVSGLLMRLEQLGILDAFSREIVINRLFAIDPREIDEHRVKWLVLMVLIDDPENETALSTLEQMMKTEATERFH